MFASTNLIFSITNVLFLYSGIFVHEKMRAHALFTPKNTSADTKRPFIIFDKSIELQSHNKRSEEYRSKCAFFCISINTKGNVNVSHIIGVSNFRINLFRRYETLIDIYNQILFADYINFYFTFTVFERIIFFTGLFSLFTFLLLEWFTFLFLRTVFSLRIGCCWLLRYSIFIS